MELATYQKRSNTFKFSFAADYSYLIRLSIVLLFCCAPLVLLAFLGIRLPEYRGFALTLFFICLIGISMFVILILYVLRVVLIKGPVLVIDNEGLIEWASYFQVGRIPLNEIATVDLISHWIQDLLVIRLFIGSPTWVRHSKRGILVQILGFLSAHRVVIPLDFLDVEPQEVKRAIEFLRSLRTDDVIINYSGAAHKNWMAQDREESATHTGTSHAATSQSHRVPFDGRREYFRSDSQYKFRREKKKKSSLTQGKKNKEIRKILSQVEAIKKKVSESNFDQMVCDLFYDDIRYFARGTSPSESKKEFNRQNKLLPYGVKNPQVVEDKMGHEKHSFEFEGHHFIFSFKLLNHSKTTGAYLTIDVDKKCVCEFQVLMEIGGMSPRSLIRFITGSWEKSLKNLEKNCKDFHRNQSHAVLMEDSKEDSIVTEVCENTEVLKKNFGLSEDGDS